MLSLNENELYSIQALDEIPKNVSQAQINKILNKNQSETGGLTATLKLQLNVRIMLTCNINVEGRLTNNQIGAFKKIVLDTENNVNKIYVKLDDSQAGIKAMNNDNDGKQNGLVSVDKTLCHYQGKARQTFFASY